MVATTFPGGGFTDAEAASRLKRIKRLAWLVDAAFVIPGTKFRFGLNALIGLAPGAGEAAQLGVPRHLLMRMIGNVVVEVVGGSVPVLGDLFDVALKANVRNIRILEDHLRATGFG